MTMCSSLDMGIVYIALPAISEDLNVTMSILSWIMMGFLISLTACILVSGRLIDGWGIHRVLISGFIIFIIGLFLSAVSPSILLLVVSRCIQGIGGSILLVGGPSLLKLSLPQNRQAEGFGYLSTASALGFFLGPGLGGLIMTGNNWRLIFWVMIVPVLIALFFVIRTDPPSGTLKGTTVNPILTTLLFGAIISFVTAVNQGREWGWTSAPILTLLILSIFLVYLFFILNENIKPKLLDFSLFRLKAFKIGNITGFLMKFCEGGPLFLLPFYFVIIQKLSLQMASFLMIVVPVIIMICGGLYGRYATRYPPSVFMAFGMLFLSFSFIGFFIAPVPVLFTVLASLMVVRGFGIGLFYPPNRTQVINAVPIGEEGIGSGFLRLVEQLGYILSIAVFETIFSEIVPMKDMSLASISQTTPIGIIVTAFHAVFILGSGITVMILGIIIYSELCNKYAS